jgi:OOP family OmpA-OmpF porin
LINRFSALVSVALLSVPATSSASQADSGFFASIHGGISSNRLMADSNDAIQTDRNDSAYHLRGGYRWGSALNYGVEVGYVDLGHASATLPYYGRLADLDGKTAGVTVGGNLLYDFNDSNWFIGLRGGWFDARNELVVSIGSSTQGTLKYDASGWYAGIQSGYKITENLRMGVAFDTYGNRAEVRDANWDEKFDTELYSGFFEYVF